MAGYDVTLVQVNGNIFGYGVNSPASAFGFPTGPFDTVLFSMWTCLPPLPTSGTSGGGPAYTNFFSLDAVGASNTLQFGIPSPATQFFNGTFTNSPSIGSLRSHHLISVNCATQTVQYYVNDVPITLTSGGWTSTGSFHFTTFSNGWLFDVGSGFGLAFPAFADVWFANTSSFIDLTVTANRRKFINSDLTPVDLGSDGSLPLGHPPPIFQTILSGGVPNDFLINRGIGPDFTLHSDITLSFQLPGTCTLPIPRELHLVKLYDMESPTSVFAITNDDNADFPDSFHQVSLSVWLCKAVDIRSRTAGIVMQFRPAHATIVVQDSTGNLLFSGSFSNPAIPNPIMPKDEYHVAFSLDTEAQTYTFRGNGIAWTPAVTWGSPGEIAP